MLYTEEELRAIAEVVVANDFYVVADEMYENLVYGEQKHVSIASLGKDIYDRTITCSGVAKSYAMTGWRIGYTGSSKEIAKMMGSVQSHQTSNPNSIAQKATVEALNGPQDSVAAMHDEFDKRRKYMYERIQKMPHWRRNWHCNCTRLGAMKRRWSYCLGICVKISPPQTVRRVKRSRRSSLRWVQVMHWRRSIAASCIEFPLIGT